MKRTIRLMAVVLVLLPARLSALELVRDATPGPAGSVHGLMEFQGSLYFVSLGELWRSDGTESGTVPVLETDIPQGGVLGQVGGRIVFQDGEFGALLRSTDGTANVNELLIPEDPSDPFFFDASYVAFGDVGRLAFGRYAEGIKEIYSTNGTAGGTAMLLDVFAAGGIGDPFLTFREFEGQRVIYELDTPSGREAHVIHDDVLITPFATSSIIADYPALATFMPPASVSPLSLEFVPGGSQIPLAWLLFEVDSGTGSLALHRTRLGQSTAVGPLHTYSTSPHDRPYVLGNLGGRALLRWRDATIGNEPRISGGTPASTADLADIAGGIDSSFVAGALPLGPKILFTADDQVTGKELWSTDGTTPGTFLLEDTDPGPSGFVTSMGVVGGGSLALFRACTAMGCEPWVTDGTPGHTHPLGDINPGPADSIASASFLDTRPVVEVGNTVFLRLDDGVHGLELWSVSIEELACIAAPDAPACGPSVPTLPPLGLALLCGLTVVAGLRALRRPLAG